MAEIPPYMPEQPAGRRHPSESLKERDGLEAELDEALLGTFPASDSPSMTSTIVPGNPPRRDRF